MVSVVLPCFNPPQDWELTVYHHFSRFTERIKEPAELIIVLDGPADMVPQSQLNYLIERLQQVHVVNNGVNYGKGYALRAAVQQAKGQLIIYTDIDFPYTHDSLYAVYDALTQQHCDIAVGTKNNDYYRHLTPIRRVISLTLQRLIRLFLAMPITDT
ncbi:MAG: glycosyltransferase, partial [Chitinophagia bacterium]|nr:glycosyltransferase [Chitinophagia bacterium]